MALWADHQHLISSKILRARPTESLPSGTALQFDRVAQLVHRECVLMGVEKDLY
jgi:hypothetical protein